MKEEISLKEVTEYATHLGRIIQMEHGGEAKKEGINADKLNPEQMRSVMQNMFGATIERRGMA